MKDKTINQTLAFVIAALIALIIHGIVLFNFGCSTKPHRRELLQAQHPDCYVEEDLVIVCPEIPDRD